MKKLMKQKVLGACLGTAIGDALGMPAESKKPETIKRLYGTITSYKTPKSAKDGKPFHHNLRRGNWTDDTQLTLAIGEAIVERKCIDYEYIAHKHIDAYKTKRGWGSTTRTAIERMLDGVKWYEAGVNGKAGNGVAMKVSPLGILYGLGLIDGDRLKDSIETIGKMTHLDNRAVVGGIIQAKVIGKVMGSNIDFSHILWNALGTCMYIEEIPEKEDEIQLGRCLSKALFMAHNNKDDDEIREKIGAGAFICESLPFTYAMLYKYYKTPRACLEKIVNMGGDADTNASMAGAILGAMYGTSWLPLRWLFGLEDRRRIVRMANGLFSLRGV